MMRDFQRGCRLAGAVWLAVAIWTTPVRAENPFLTQAVTAYEDFEFDQALSLLQKALDHPGTSGVELARIHLYLGLVRFTLGDREAAEREFGLALKLNRKLALPPDTSPKIVTSFEQVRAALPPEPKPPEPKPPGLEPGPGPEPPPVIGPPVRPAPPKKARLWTWIVGGVGLAALAGGGACGGLAMQSYDDFKNEPFASEADGLRDTIETRAMAANILYGVGGVALATAVVLFFVEGSSDEPPASAAVQLLPGPLGMAARVKF